jgi:hypothetical protein
MAFCQTLLGRASGRCHQTGQSALRARKGSRYWKGEMGAPWSQPEPLVPDPTTGMPSSTDPSQSNLSEHQHEESASDGDDVLANSVLRMRDSMIHYLFQYSVARGDIGWVLQILKVCALFCSVFPHSCQHAV